MKKAALSLILFATLSLAPALTSCAPPIPHTVEARKECVSCHGSDGARPYPAWHAKRSYKNDDCSSCHRQKPDTHKVAGAVTK